MYYKVLINGAELGTFGHPAVQDLHLSVGGGDSGLYFFATAVCAEGERRVFFDWMQHELQKEDVVEIFRTDSQDVPEPRKRFVMGRPQREPSADLICDFCQRNETQVPRLVRIDEHRPSICSDCVDLCNEILKSPA